jgi:RNase P subunit RPR2
MSNRAEPPVSPLICGKCKLPLALGKVTAMYLGSEFPVELWKCPGCGKIFVPEELAIGKMLRVEQALEDK